jgi:2-polyprenyl-3-methyl-5-hydroxy-6-metoxy-1,4-benzoquinol methylase
VSSLPPYDHATYARRLAQLQGRWWKRLLDVQRPYRWYLRRLKLGFVLDIGCGLGRSLINSGSQGVGVDLNPFAVQACKANGLEAYTPEEFEQTRWAQGRSFDSLIVAHALEHMSFDEARDLLKHYLQRLKHDGRVVMITPQERGHTSDDTHVDFFNFEALLRLSSACGLEVQSRQSFPLPRLFGRIFKHNEFIVVATCGHDEMNGSSYQG